MRFSTFPLIALSLSITSVGCLSESGLEVPILLPAPPEAEVLPTLDPTPSDSPTPPGSPTPSSPTPAPGCAVTVSSVSPNPVDPGAPLTLVGTVTDVAASPLTTLEVGLKDTLETPLYLSVNPDRTGKWTLSAALLTPGAHVLTVVVTGAGVELCQSGPLPVEVSVCDSIDHDGDGYSACEGDCDDTASAALPGGVEVCQDGLDNDCEGTVDQIDLDEDGTGACDLEAPDCDDQDAAVYPGALETCNGSDDNCDGALPPSEQDADHDTYRPCTGDCNDRAPSVHPGALEVCGDSIDNNCNGQTDESTDLDADGFNSCQDCNDTDASSYPGASEGPDQDGDGTPECDGKDNNCNGVPDDGTSCRDDDGDGLSELQGDCDDALASIHPGALEVCGDSLDNNCDGTIDNGPDSDRDGFSLCGSSEKDCNDADATIYPGAPERCDGFDDDCDGQVPTNELDLDHDGFAGCAMSGNPSDCDDNSAYTYPGAIERSDQQDNDCDGHIEGILSLANAHVRLAGDLAAGQAGGALSAGLDIDGDGHGDVVIGAPGYDVASTTSQSRGAAFLLFGRSSGWPSDGRIVDKAVLIYGEEPGARAGFSVSMAGDLNADGYGDFAIGSPYHTVPGYNAVGQTSIFFGRPSGWVRGALNTLANATVDGQVISTTSSNIDLGYALTGALTPGRGDFNADGIDDLVIGCPWTSPIGGYGFVVVVPGRTSDWGIKLKQSDVSRLQGAFGQVVGQSVAFVGPDGSDAIVDLLTGSAYDGASNTGAALYVEGSTLYDPNILSSIALAPAYYGGLPGEQAGQTVSGAVDLNGDGLAELLIGQKTASQDGSLASLMFGRTSIPPTGALADRADLRFLSGRDGLDECPCVVQGVGDMNGDGLDDMALAVVRNDAGGKDAGKVYIFHGRAGLTDWGFNDGTSQVELSVEDADMAMTGELADDQAGTAMAAGDLNGDGLSDLVIGAPRWDGKGTSNAGRVYIIFGAYPGHNPVPVP